MLHEEKIIAFMVTELLSSLKDDPHFLEKTAGYGDDDNTLFVRWVCRDPAFKGVKPLFLSQLDCPVLCHVYDPTGTLSDYYKTLGYKAVGTCLNEHGVKNTIMYRAGTFTFLCCDCTGNETRINSIKKYVFYDPLPPYVIGLLMQLHDHAPSDSVMLTSDDGYMRVSCSELLQYLMGTPDTKITRECLIFMRTQFPLAHGLLKKAQMTLIRDNARIKRILDASKSQSEREETAVYYDVKST